jgi:phosphate transport system substrate-binding protein
VSQWESSYGSATANQVTYSAGGAGAGVSSLTDRTVDFAATDDPLNASQRALLLSPVLTLPVTAGALAIVYNLPGVTQPIQLSGPILADIYLGSVTNWNDSAIASDNTGVALPDQTIVTVHRSDPAGTTYVLTDFLTHDSPAWAAGPGRGIDVTFPSNPPTAIAQHGNSGLAGYVGSNPYTIGYVDLTDVLLTPGLQYAKVLNPAGHYILPTLADTASAIANRSAVTQFPSTADDWGNVSMVNSAGTSDYPLSTFAYFFVYQAFEAGNSPSLERAQVLEQWLQWVITSGQNDSANLYYVTLPPALVTLVHQGLTTLTFNGQAIPTCG